MKEVFLIRSPDEIVLFLQLLTGCDKLKGDEHAMRIVALSKLAYLAKERGELEAALQYEREAYTFCLQLSDTFEGAGFLSLVAAKLYNMGQLYYKMGKSEKAKSCFEQAREFDAKAGNFVGQAADIRSLGFLQQDAGNLQGALELHKEALRLDYKAGFEYGVAVDQANIGVVYLELHDFQQALQYFAQALASFQACGQVQEAEKVRQLMQTAESGLT